MSVSLSLSPSQLQHPGPVLQRLREVVHLDIGRAFEVGDGAADFEHPVVGTRTEVHLAHCGAHEGLGVLTQDTKCPDLPRPHIGIAGHAQRCQPCTLAVARGFHPGADGGGGFAQRGIGEFVVFHAGHLDVQVNAVQERTGDALAVALDHAHGTGASPLSVTKIATLTGIHSSD